MSFPSRGDGNLPGTPFINNELAAGSTDASKKVLKTTAANYPSNGVKRSSGFMDRVRRAQENFADSCCSCVEDIPTPLFLALVIFLLGMLILFIVALTTWAASKSELLRRGNESLVDDEEIDDDDDGFNSTEKVESFFSIFTNQRPMSPNLQLCKGYGFTCKSAPWLVIGLLQRCDGFSDCPDGSDEEKCRECNTAFKCRRRISTKKIYYQCLRGDKLCDGTEDCDDGDDEQMCKRKCGDQEYQCHPKGICIPKEFKCDGDIHCPNRDDENECEGKCNNGAVWCPNSNACIPKWKTCDGVWDCMYGEDEKNCSCRDCCGTNRTLCASSSICISRSSICNGIHDCPDGADEENCPGICKKSILKKIDTVLCSDGRRYNKRFGCSGLLKICDGRCDQCTELHAFTCKWGNKVKCIAKSEVCDGKNDCPDGSDEADCIKESFRHCARNYGMKTKWLRQEQICDGVYDCIDKDDEQKCTYCSNGILCPGTRVCLTEFQRCDGVIDCLDGSDERGCTCEECAYRWPPMFKCAKSDQCVKFEEACERCPEQTPREKTFCAMRKYLN